MCRNIKTLFNFDPPANEKEIGDEVFAGEIERGHIAKRSLYPLLPRLSKAQSSES